MTSGSGATSGVGIGGARGGAGATSAGLGLGESRSGQDLAAPGSSEPSGSDGIGALAKARDSAEAAEAARAAAAAAVAAQASAKQLADIAARAEGPVAVAVAEAAQGAVRTSAEAAQQAADAAAEARNPATSQLALAGAVVRAQKAAARAKEAAEEASDDMLQVVTAAPEAPRADWLIRVRRNMEAQTAFETGKARYEAHDLMGARRHLENAVQLNPELDEARALLGWAEFFSGATRASTVTFKTTLRRQPTWEGLYNGLGWSRLRLNRPQLARDAFRAALDANPAYTDAMAGWGLALYELDEYAAAIPALDQATATLEASLGRDAAELVDLREALAWSLYRTGRFGEAAVEFERVIKARPGGPEPQAALGWSYLRLGRRGEARAAFLRALELAPNSPDAARGLSQASATP